MENSVWSNHHARKLRTGVNLISEFLASTDAGYLTDADDLKSQMEDVFVFNGGAIDWRSTKAKPIFAELQLQKLSIFALIMLTKVAVLGVANESGITKGARHFRAKVYYLREVIEYGDIKLEKVHTNDNLANPFTKVLAFPKHSEHTRNIGMLPASSLKFKALGAKGVVKGSRLGVVWMMLCGGIESAKVVSRVEVMIMLLML
ncbi:hypothetical protein Tco_0084693 [Tanacetum coccineum]